MQSIYCTNQEIFDEVQRIDPAHNDGYMLDDKSNGKLFAEVFGDVARYNTTTRLYSIYDGIRWIVDKDNLFAEGVAQRLADALYLYGFDQDEAHRKHYTKLGQYGPMKTMLLEARNFHQISDESFDQHPELLNLQNGTLNLESFEFREHRAGDLLSRVCNASYDPEAKAETFIRFISQVTEVEDGNGGMRPDPDKADYLQRILGYALLGSCEEDEFYMLFGPTTRNGKSTLLSTVGHVLGDYSKMLTPDTLAQRQRTSSNNEEIADLRGVRFVHCEEPSKQMVLDTALIKNLTGRSKVSVSRKYEHLVEFLPEFKIFFATNYLPTVTDMSMFDSNRCNVLRFDRHFTDEEQDKGLRGKLFAESAGIINWMLDGLARYYLEKTVPPAAVVDATAEYKNASDKIGNFLNECTQERKGNNVSLNELYNKYSNWCEESGYLSEGKGKFSEALKRRNMLYPTGTINGRTEHNVIKDIEVTSSGGLWRFDQPVTMEDNPFTK